MPSQGEYQESAGKEYGSSCGCSIPEVKAMEKMGPNGLPGFVLNAPEYKGNAALLAQRVKK